MRIHTDSWSIGVFGVQKPNIQSTASSGAHAVAQALMAEAERRRGDVGPGHEALPVKRWGVPTWDVAGIVIAIALSGWYFYLA